MSEELTRPAVQPIMEMSADISAIAKVLPKAQAAMGDVIKNANNPAFKSKYADLGAVIEAVVPALNSHGITLLQPPGYDSGNGVVMVSTMLLHESGQWVRCTLGMPLGKRDAQGVGSAVTYGRRFGLQAMSGVAPTDDDGNAASRPPTPTRKFTPDPEGPDFPGASGPGRSAYSMKQTGADKRFMELKGEIEALTSMTEVGLWTKDRGDEIRTFPEGWRKILRETLDEQKRAIAENDFRGGGADGLAGDRGDVADAA